MGSRRRERWAFDHWVRFDVPVVQSHLTRRSARWLPGGVPAITGLATRRASGVAAISGRADEAPVLLEPAQRLTALAELLEHAGEVEAGVGVGAVARQRDAIGLGGLRQPLLILQRDAEVVGGHRVTGS